MSESKTPETELVRLTPFESAVLRDYYHSFRHSQGDPRLQGMLMLYIVKHYDYKDVGNISDLKNKLDKFISEMSIPEEHTHILMDEETKQDVLLDHQKAQYTDFGFQRSWLRLIATLERVFLDRPNPQDVDLYGFYRELYNQSLWPKSKLLLEIAARVLYVDGNYQIRERPNRKVGRDPHASFFRNYVIDGKLTGSPVYDKLYNDVGKLFESLGIGEITSLNELRRKGEEVGLSGYEVTRIAEIYSDLQSSWEGRHEGQKFFS